MAMSDTLRNKLIGELGLDASQADQVASLGINKEDDFIDLRQGDLVGKLPPAIARKLIRVFNVASEASSPATSSTVPAPAPVPSTQTIIIKDDDLKKKGLIELLQSVIDRGISPELEDRLEEEAKLEARFVPNSDGTGPDWELSLQLNKEVKRRKMPKNYHGRPVQTLRIVLQEKTFANPFTGEELFSDSLWLTKNIPLDRRATVTWAILMGLVQHADEGATITAMASNPIGEFWAPHYSAYKIARAQGDPMAIEAENYQYYNETLSSGRGGHNPFPEQSGSRSSRPSTPPQTPRSYTSHSRGYKSYEQQLADEISWMAGENSSSID